MTEEQQAKLKKELISLFKIHTNKAIGANFLYMPKDILACESQFKRVKIITNEYQYLENNKIRWVLSFIGETPTRKWRKDVYRYGELFKYDETGFERIFNEERLEEIANYFIKEITKDTLMWQHTLFVLLLNLMKI